jgi:hypothetical protein
MLAGLTLGSAWCLPGLAALDADGGTAALALTNDQPAAHASRPTRWAVVGTDSAASGSAVAGTVSAFPGEPDAVTSNGAGATTGFPSFQLGLENPLAFPLTTDLLQGLTSLRATGESFPSALVHPGWGSEAGNAADIAQGGGGWLSAPELSLAGGFGMSTRTTAGEAMSVNGHASPAALTSAAALPGTTTASSAQAAQIRQHYGQLPLRFEANEGQTDAQVQFLAHGAGYSLFLTGTDAVMTLQVPATTPRPDHLGTPAALPPAGGSSAVLRMQVVGGNPAAQGVGEQPLPGQINYFVGNDPRQWHTHVTSYGRVDYASVYPGIDLTYYGNQQQLEYDFVVAPGADPSRIRLGFTGADSLTVDGQGALEVQAGGHVLRQQAPVLYQDIAGVRQPVAGRFVVAGPTVGFAAGAYDTSRPLIIDPVLSYSTYLGGSGYYGGPISDGDSGAGIAVDGAGNAYLTGDTYSTDFPTANAFQPSKGGGLGSLNAFVTKVSADGSSLVYSSYLGGSGGDYGYGIAVDGAGNAYLTGDTFSSDFPTVNAFQPNLNGPYNAFVTKVSADGSSLIYSSYLGGSGGDYGDGIAVDGAGNAYLTGQTYSSDFPTANAFQPNPNGPSNAFVTKVSVDGSSLVYSSYLGGSGGDAASGIAVDGAGNAYLTGDTYSTDFPTANAFQPTKGGASGVSNAFVTKVSADGSSLVYSSYLGGTNVDAGHGIALDGAGNAYVTGSTLSTDFPTANAFQPTKGGAYYVSNAFVTKVSVDGSSLVYSSYLGGSGLGDYGDGIAVDGAGNAYLTGQTYSSDFPTANAFQPTKGGAAGVSNAFVTKVSVDGSSLVYSSYLGGSDSAVLGGDVGARIAVDGAGSAYVIGTAYSADFPTANAFQPLKAGTGAFQSTDGGTTWHAINGTRPNGLTNGDVRSLAVDSASPSTLYAGTSGGGVFQSTDAGGTWTAVNNGLTNAKVRSVLVDAANSAILYAGTSGGGVFQSTDAGASWSASNNGLTNLNVQTLVVDPTNSATLYVGSSGGGAFQSTDGGASWNPINNGLTDEDVRSLAVDPTSPATLYAGTASGVFQSTNGGSSWVPINNGLPTIGLSTYALALDPTTPSTLYTSLSYRVLPFTHYSVYKSTNSGGSWSDSSSGLPDNITNALVIDPVTPSTLYAATGRGIYKSINGGGNWSQTSLVGSVQAVTLDPTAPFTVYAGDIGSGQPSAFVAKIS